MDTTNFNLDDLRDDDVVSLNGSLLKVEKLRDILDKAVKKKMPEIIMQTFVENGAKISSSADHMNSTERMQYVRNLWLVDGIETEILQVGASQSLEGKIKLKVSVEFEPAVVEAEEYEEPLVFPLDEIRQTLNGVNSIDA